MWFLKWKLSFLGFSKGPNSLKKPTASACGVIRTTKPLSQVTAEGWASWVRLQQNAG